jgi:hypothetical protein
MGKTVESRVIPCPPGSAPDIDPSTGGELRFVSGGPHDTVPA